jgi:hypothetical protein
VIAVHFLSGEDLFEHLERTSPTSNATVIDLTKTADTPIKKRRGRPPKQPTSATPQQPIAARRVKKGKSKSLLIKF